METKTWVMSEKRGTAVEAYLHSPAARRVGWIRPDQEQWFPKTRPAVLICPGGGYNHISEREAEPIALNFLNAGYQAFVLRYAIGEDSAYPAPWVEVSRALRLIRFHAQDFDIDPDRVAIVGFSAGGHLAAWLSTSFNDAELLAAEKTAVTGSGDAPMYPEEPQALAQVSNRPDAAVLGYALTDLAADMPDHEVGTPVSEDYALATMPWLPGRILLQMHPKIMLNDLVTSDNPPTFLWTTAEDTLVAPSQTLNFAGELIKAGVICEAHVFPYGVHGLSTADSETCCDGREIRGNVTEWLPLALRFLSGIFE